MAGEEDSATPPNVSGRHQDFRPVPADEVRVLETRCTYRRVAAGRRAHGALRQRLGGVFHRLGPRAGRSPPRWAGRDHHRQRHRAATRSARFPRSMAAAPRPRSSPRRIASSPSCRRRISRRCIVRRGEVALSLLQRWAAIIRDLDDKVSLVSSIGPEQRVYSELIRLARVEQPGSDRWMVPEMPSHQDLAVRAQTTREAVAGAIAETRQPRHRRAPHPRALHQRLQGLEGHDPATARTCSCRPPRPAPADRSAAARGPCEKLARFRQRRRRS